MPVIKHNHGWDNSYPAFKPSIYSTGVQSTQPYTPDWPEGSQYGAWYNHPLVSPAGWAFSKVSDAVIGAKEESTAGQCVDHTGALGRAGAKVPCDSLAAAMGVKEKNLYDKGEEFFEVGDHDPDVGCDTACQRRNATLTVLVAATLGILTTVAVTRHIKYGKVI